MIVDHCTRLMTEFVSAAAGHVGHLLPVAKHQERQCKFALQKKCSNKDTRTALATHRDNIQNDGLAEMYCLLDKYALTSNNAIINADN